MNEHIARQLITCRQADLAANARRQLLVQQARAARRDTASSRPTRPVRRLYLAAWLRTRVAV